MIPEWIKHLSKGDEILCVFGFSGRNCYVTIEETVDLPYTIGYWVRYSNDNEDALWILEFQKYGTQPERDHWIAYEVLKHKHNIESDSYSCSL